MTMLATIFCPEGGHFALALACALALMQGVLPLAGLRRTDSPLTALARPLALSQCLALLFAWTCLVTASLGNDFSLKLIAETSAINKPWAYKIAGLWGNHEGSLLLWVTLLSLWCAGLALLPGQSAARPEGLPLRLRARLLALLGLVGAGFQLFCLTTSNPFLRLWPVPADGMGMNPLLQDPGLAVHPPLLYSGYVGFAVPFAFAISALLDGRADALWARHMRPWVISAWALLTLGITLGSWWSYSVLGWGGYWFWDPVENAALIPWLTGTALLHSVLVVEKRNLLHVWCLLLAIATFAFSLSGTFLVRSGILNSVHAFANDPARGLFILGLLGLYGGGSLLLFAIRAPALPTPQAGFSPLSRESALLLNNILLCTLCAVVLTGTLYPPFMQLLFGRTLSVGKPFFDATTIPLTLPLLAVMGVSMALPWRQTRADRLLPRLAPALLITAGNILPAFWLFPTPLAALSALLALWVISAALCDLILRLRGLPEGSRQLHRLPRSLWAASLAHVGVGVTILGLCGMAGSQERLIEARPGTHATLTGRDWELTALTAHHGPNYEAVEAHLTIRHHDAHGPVLTELTPEIRLFPRQGQRTLHVAILHRPLEDLYAALGSVKEERDPQGQSHYSAILRLHENPLASWIWLGGIIMALGGGLHLLPSRRRPKPMEGEVGSCS
ncbi:heme lyase CcmF/NrfE family subunit [Parasaccharibacter sp. TMW 2.1891]|uniref:heme lyase CcmF/NrfE family subunit n=1 Tax=Parasaccharibacter sp. TMW 2.1891 TaxID=2267836 RepID=UPI002012734D|nr:heme lyase CcmF/NrfE family subunit [Parasaccharibacter sp. TMW 2.1891]